MADYEFIKYEQDGNIVTITINRPERMNSIHPPTTEELSDAWDTFAADDSAWVGILTGAGERAFSAGNDLKYTAEMSRVPANERPTFAPVQGGFGGITAD
ncbi:MAG: enoyl-CoA hydratase, partial [Chloroflexi bacterium]|nr:enoyl-CoA hydratase [Chloroflexota bacterium]